MHHKRGRPKNRRAGCLLCKPWKANGCRNSTWDGKRRQVVRAHISEREQRETAGDWWYALNELSLEG